MFKKIFFILLIITNIYAFFNVKNDKETSIDGGYREPEVRIIAVSSLGAVPGTMLGFKVFNHKTNLQNKGYLWDALYIVLVENLVLYGVVFLRRSGASEEKSKYPLYMRKHINRY